MTIRILQGDCREVLASMEAGSVRLYVYRRPECRLYQLTRQSQGSHVKVTPQTYHAPKAQPPKEP